MKVFLNFGICLDKSGMKQNLLSMREKRTIRERREIASHHSVIHSTGRTIVYSGNSQLRGLGNTGETMKIRWN